MDSAIVALIIWLSFLFFSSDGQVNARSDKDEEPDLRGKGLVELDISSLKKPNTIVSLILSRNKLQNLPKELFSITRKLEVLDLQDNLFKKFPSGSLKKLTTLNLSRNRIKKIELEPLKNMTSLRILDLSFNQLKELPGNFLHVLVTLGETQRDVQLYLQNNQIISLPEEFIPESDILKTVRLSNNLITSLPNKLFKAKKKSVLSSDTNPHPTLNFDISSNFIREILNGTLDDMSIQTLNVSSNDISFVHRDAFANMKSLKRLDMSRNSITDSLKTMSVKVSKRFGLLRLNLEHNKITSEEKSDEILFNLPQLFHVNLMHNQIKKFCPLCFSLSVGEMFLDHNAIEDMHITAEQMKTLSRNRTSFLKISLQGNPVVNLVKQDVFEEFNTTHPINVTLPINVLTDKINCDCLNMKTIEVLSRFNINWSVNVPCWSLSAGSDYHAALEDKYSCEMGRKCGIPNCYCDHIYNNPTPLTNYIRKQKTHFFCNGAPNLSNSDVYPIYGESNLKNLDVLVKVKRFESNDGQIDLKNLSSPGIKVSLDLSYANMTELPKMILPNSTSAVYLDNNLLTSISASNVDNLEQFLGSNSQLKATISKNPWVCNCEELWNFCSLLEQYHSQIADVDSTACTSNDVNSGGEKKILIFCSSCRLAEQKRKTMVTAIVAVFMVAVALILVAIFAYWKCIKKKKAYKYDAFVSFAHTESDFVYNNLIPALETTTENVKVCVHSRDWIAGVSIMDNLLDSLAQSKCFLAVISRDYLSSSWCCKEFKTMYRMDRKNIILVIVNIPDDREIAAILPELKYHIREFTYVFAYEENLQSKLIKRMRDT